MQRYTPRRQAIGVGLAVALILGAGWLVAEHFTQGSASTQPVTTPAARILVLFNARRARIGLKPLRADPVLASLARAHNRDELAHGYFAHDAPQGQTFYERMASLHRREVGEVIAWGTGGFATAAGFMSLWMSSPEHKRIILMPSLRRVGISVLGGTFQGQRRARVATADFSN